MAFGLPWIDRKTDLMLVSPWVSGVPTYPPRNYRTFAIDGFSRNAVAYACIVALAQSASEITLKAEQKITGQWVRSEDETIKTPMADYCQALLDKPNPHQDQFEYLQDIIVYLHVAGNAYNQVEASKSGLPIALWHLQPNYMSPIPDRNTLIQGWVYRPAGPEYRLKNEQIVHFRLTPDPLNNLLGLSPFAAIARETDSDNAASDFLKAFFDKGGVPAWAAMFKARVNQTQANQFRKMWQEQFSVGQGGNPQGVAVLNANEVMLQKVGVNTSNRELGLTDMRMVVDARVCGVFRVHPQIAFSLLGFLHPTFAQARMAEEVFWNLTLLPLYRRLAGALTRQLQPYYGSDVRIVADFSRVSALQEDEKSRWSRFLEAAKFGFITREEFREFVQLRRQPIGTYLVPLGVIEQVPGEPLAPRIMVRENVNATLGDVQEEQITDETLGPRHPSLPPPPPPGREAPAAPKNPAGELLPPPDITPPRRVAPSGLPDHTRQRSAPDAWREEKALDAQQDAGFTLGGMVAFYLPPAIAQQAALADGEPPEALHLTLAVFDRGDADRNRTALLAMLKDVADRTPPMSGSVGGVLRFPVPGGEEPFCLHADVPALPPFRQTIVETLARAGVRIATDHGYTPHVTLASLAPDAPNPYDRRDPIGVSFGTLSVSWKDGPRYDFPLGGSTAPAEPKQAPVPEQKTLAAPAVKASLHPKSQHLADRLQQKRSAIATKRAPELEAFFGAMAKRVAHRTNAMATASVDAARREAKDYPFDEDSLVPPDENRRLWVVLKPILLEAMQAAWDANMELGGLDTAWDVLNPFVEKILSSASSLRVKQINDATRSALRDLLAVGVKRGYDVYQLANGVPDDGYAGIKALVEELYTNRALAIARSEVAWSQNHAVIAQSRAAKLTQVQLSDGDYDDTCAARDGSVLSLDKALAEIESEHPNGTLAVLPLIPGWNIPDAE